MLLGFTVLHAYTVSLHTHTHILDCDFKKAPSGTSSDFLDCWLTCRSLYHTSLLDIWLYIILEYSIWARTRRENRCKVSTLGRMQMRHNDITNMLIGTWWPLFWAGFSYFPLKIVDNTAQNPWTLSRQQTTSLPTRTTSRKKVKYAKWRILKNAIERKRISIQHTYISSSTFQ